MSYKTFFFSKHMHVDPTTGVKQKYVCIFTASCEKPTRLRFHLRATLWFGELQTV